MKQYSPAAERNQGPILTYLRKYLRSVANVLEVASGTGQHAVAFANELPHLRWHPSDYNPEAVASIESWISEEGCSNVALPIVLDVTRPPPEWKHSFDAVFNANMIHISPWESCLALFDLAESLLSAGGFLLLYGPFIQEDVTTAQSNVDFDASLRSRDTSWGIRKLADVVDVAKKHSFDLQEVNSLPANNLLVCFLRL